MANNFDDLDIRQESCQYKVPILTITSHQVWQWNSKIMISKLDRSFIVQLYDQKLTFGFVFFQSFPLITKDMCFSWLLETFNWAMMATDLTAQLHSDKKRCFVDLTFDIQTVYANGVLCLQGTVLFCKGLSSWRQKIDATKSHKKSHAGTALIETSNTFFCAPSTGSLFLSIKQPESKSLWAAHASGRWPSCNGAQTEGYL